MFHLHKNVKMRVLACLLICSMILTAISPGIVVRAEEESLSGTETTTWNFHGGEEDAFVGGIEGNTGEFNGLQIDATAGKLEARSGDTQMNKGTTIAVPVSGSAIVAVKTNSGYHNYTINGKVADSDNFEYTYTGEEGYVTIEATGQVYLFEVSRTPIKNEVPAGPELPADTSKIDVWDFGAEQLNAEIYNNKLTVDIINNEIFSGVTPGSASKNLASFSLNKGEFLFDDGTYSTTHRLRTTNKELTRYDEKSLVGTDGTIYRGYLYSNKGSAPEVYLGVYLYHNDILTLVVASNGNNSTINVESPSGKIAKQVHTNGGSTATEMRFYASEAGTYKIYSSDEKLVVARVYREHTNSVEVTGTVNAPAELSGYDIAFTNKQTGEVTLANIEGANYSATLSEQYDYDVTLKNANGYVVSSASLLSIAFGDGDQDFDITIEAVDLVTLTGAITGLSTEALNKLKLSFEAESIYVPELNIFDNGAYTLQLENGVEYKVVVEGINDYSLLGNGKISATENNNYNFEFVEKTKHPVNLTLVNIDEAAKNSGKITFTNIKEEGYSYTYDLSAENIELRDGQYSVDVAGTGEYPIAMTLTPDVKVAGASANATIKFTNLSSWNFGALNKAFGGQGIESINGIKYYYGLKLSDTGVAEDKGYLLMNAGGDIVVPVKAKDIVTINYCYSASFQINDGSVIKVDEESKSTTQIDTVTYTATDDGTITISCIAGTKASKTYLTGITVTTPVEHKEVITVGNTGSDYTSINDALDAVKEMYRPNNERVTIEIQPGNYEEMLVVDVPNVTLKNASTNPSIALKDKGVGIADEAVRITSYYGHGYSYYSMGTDNKYSAEALEVNTANGYLSQHNPGSGTTNGSYWNATVVVMADGFNAEGIIFENSFNQYISEKEANDIVELETGNKGTRSKVAGDTSVQDKSFVERAAALAIANDADQAVFSNCRFVGRQDTLYGGSNVRAAFDKCAIMGGTDYIFGPMTAVFYKCDLVMNTSEGSTDVSYITAAQQSSGRGYLMYNCHITSTVPGVDTASAYYSKPGYLGRPWKAETSEVVFYNTVIENTNFPGSVGQSLVLPIGWNSTLGGTSPLSYEYGTMERGTADHTQRASWAKLLKEPILSDGTTISIDAFLNGKDNWNPIVMDKEENNLDNTPGFDIEIPVETPSTEVKPIDLINGLKVGTVYGGAAGITVLDDMTFKTTPQDISGITYPGYVQGSVNPDPSKGAIPTKGAVVKVNPSVDGTLTIVLKLSSGKDFYVVDKDGKQIDKITAASDTFLEEKYEMKAGDTYYIYGQGTKIPIYDLTFKKNAVKHVIDISGGLTANTDYQGIAVLENMPYKADPQTIEGAAYEGYVAGASNPSPSKGDIPTAGSVVKITPKENGKFTVAFKLNSNKTYYLIDSNKKEIDTYTAGSNNEYIVKTYEVIAGNSYYFYGQGTKLPIYGLSIVYGDDSVAWGEIENPVISDVSVSKGDIIVNYLGKVGNGYADSITINMYQGDTLKKVEKISAPGEKGSVKFTPDASGDYSFEAVLSRDKEVDKVSEKSDAVAFTLPLTKPEIVYINNVGSGSIKVAWNAVAEATSYKVLLSEDGISYKEAAVSSLKKATVEKLEIGKTYYVKVVAIRGEESIESDALTKKVEDISEISWKYSAFGSGVDTKNNGYDDSVPGTVKLWSKAGKGKLVPASTDGLAFYYTMVDTNENFKLTAKVKVNEWTFSNGQEGFGLMAADAVGVNGDASTFWNNSYMASVTKVEYLWDSSTNSVSDIGEKISMYLGVGAQEKIGVTKEKIDLMNTPGSELLSPPGFTSTMVPLETSCAKYGTGSYNIVKNNTDDKYDTQELSTDEFIFTIQRDNTGYRISFVDLEGNVQRETFYDEDRVALAGIDKENVYVGFFASRNADITVTDIKLTTSDPANDRPADPRPVITVTPKYEVISTQHTGNAEYELVYIGNADGELTIKDQKGNVITNKELVTANTRVKKNVSLTKGNNTFTITFTPDKDYKPGEYKELSTYETKTFTHTVTYKNYDRKSLYVSPSGKSSGDGSKNNPLDIYTAVKYVTPGQKIVLAGGTYSMLSSLTVERGIDGTEDAMIYMIADPEAATRPVLDFNKKVTGVVFAGDYWYIQGIDVTNSANGQKGLQLSGSNCVLDDIHAYRNGNTGIQLSRFKSSDSREDWPENNLILNCTSYANADKGYEDADGFAAKLTIGDGNVFDGCIAYNNADDGWDLFAKVETGPIGKVIIKNSVAYGNGYLPDGTNAGNGNGFKMGGSSITGYHTLINSIAFDNKAKGIDSNSCPDIQVYNSTSFNNESYNVAFYTNDAKNTDFFADGVISYKTDHFDTNDNFKLLGVQEKDDSKVRGLTNYYWNNGKSANTENATVSDDWFVSTNTEVKITRNADGTINMNGLLELTDKAPENVGARMTGTPSKVIEIEEETVTPVPTSTPSRPTTPSPTEVPFNPNETVNVTVSVDASGNVKWNEVNKAIKEKLDAFNKIENAENANPLSIAIDMKTSTVLGKELLETVKGQNVQVSLELANGITWTINGEELKDQAFKNIDLAVELNSTTVPSNVINQLISSNTVRTNQISLAHDGEFGFKASLSLDLTKLDRNYVAKDKETQIAGIYYYNEKTGKLVLQSASRIDKNGKVEFNFTHASEYVVTVSDKLVVDEDTLSKVTVNGVGTSKIAKRWKYVGGTTGNMEKLEIVLPEGLQDAVNKGLIEFKASYTTSNRNVAIVSKNGIATAKAPGVAVIKTTLKIGDKTFVYSTKITVKKAFIKFVKSPKTLTVGQKATYEVAVYGFKTKDITWLTSKRNIALVYKNQGKLTAVVSGVTTGTENVLVRVIDKNGKYVYGSASVTVK